MAYDATLTDPTAIQAAMKSNSDAYASADTATQQQLHADNMKYAGQTGQTYDSQTGTYSAPSQNVAYPSNNPSTGTTGTTSLASQMNQAAQNSKPAGIDPNHPASSAMGITPQSQPIGTVPFIKPDGSTGYTSNPSAAPTLGTQSDGTLHTMINGQAGQDEKVFQGTSFSSARDLAAQLGLPYSADPKTGEISIGSVKINPTSYDKNGDAVVGVRSVADALGYKIGYDDKTKTITITGKPKDAPPVTGAANGTPTGNGYNSPIQGIYNSMPQMQPMTPWQQPDVSGFQQNMMPYQSFNPDPNSFYQQAHAQLDPQFDANNQKLMDKQNLDIQKSDESMNRRGIYSSGVAQAAEDDLRAKTTNALAAGFTAQMGQIEKVAQNLFNTAYKQYQDGNQFALKNNQDQINNMLNVEKQSFSEWAQTQKLDQSQYNYALKAWNDMASKIMTDAENQTKASQFQQTQSFDQYKFNNPSAAQQLPYQYQTANNAANNATSAANNAANNQTKEGIALLPYQNMTAYQNATTQEKQQMDAAINYFKQQGINIDQGKLMESIRHNQVGEALTANGQAITASHNAATEANAAANTQMNAYKLAGYLPNGKPTFDREKFIQTKQHDADLVNLARTNATNSENKTEIDAIGKELSSINSQINAIYGSYTTDTKQQAANTAMVTSLSGQRDQYINQLKQYTDQGFNTPPTGYTPTPISSQ